jgi:hypothetical protein
MARPAARRGLMLPTPAASSASERSTAAGTAAKTLAAAVCASRVRESQACQNLACSRSASELGRNDPMVQRCTVNWYRNAASVAD